MSVALVVLPPSPPFGKGQAEDPPGPLKTSKMVVFSRAMPCSNMGAQKAGALCLLFATKQQI